MGLAPSNLRPRWRRHSFIHIVVCLLPQGASRFRDLRGPSPLALMHVQPYLVARLTSQSMCKPSW